MHSVHMCVYTHTNSHGSYAERAAFIYLTEGLSEPFRTAQITPKAPAALKCLAQK